MNKTLVQCVAPPFPYDLWLREKHMTITTTDINYNSNNKNNNINNNNNNDKCYPYYILSPQKNEND